MVQPWLNTPRVWASEVLPGYSKDTHPEKNNPLKLTLNSVYHSFKQLGSRSAAAFL